MGHLIVMKERKAMTNSFQDTIETAVQLDRNYVRIQLPSLVRLSLPIAATQLNQIVIQSISLIVVGHIDGELMGSCALANLMCNLTGYSFAFGLCGALETLIAQAYGARCYRMMGIHAQRAVIILSLCTFILAGIWLQTEAILRYTLNLDTAIASKAGQWCRICILGIWPALMFSVIRRLYQAQKVLWPVLLATSVAATMHISQNWFWVTHMDFGFEGAALAFALTQWTSFISLVVALTVRRLLRKRGRRAAAAYLGSNYCIQVDDDVRAASPSALEFSSSSCTASVGLGAILSDDSVSGACSALAASQPCGTLPTQEHAGARGLDCSSPNCSAEERYGKAGEFSPEYGAGQGVDKAGPNCLVCRAGIGINTTGASPDCDTGVPNSNVKMRRGLAEMLGKEGVRGGTRLADPEDEWELAGWEALKGWGEFLRLGLPAAASLFIEWGSFEAAAGIAGQLGAVPLAVHSIMANTAGISYMLCLSVGVVTSTVVNHHLGAGRPGEARAAILLGLGLDLSVGLVCGLILWLLPWQWAAVFTGDADVQAAAAAVLPVMLAYFPVDACKCLALAVLRATGRPGASVGVTALACCGLLLPGGWYAAVEAGKGVAGLWAAMTAAWLLAAAVAGRLVATADWAQQASLARKRSGAGSAGPARPAAVATEAEARGGGAVDSQA